MNCLKLLAILCLGIIATSRTVAAQENDGDVADSFAQFVPASNDRNSVAGFFGFHTLKKENDACRFSGAFESGLPSSNPSDYQLKVEFPEGTTVFNLSKVFKHGGITTPGSEFFQEVFQKSELNCSEIDGKFLVLYFKGQRIGSAAIQALSF